MEMDAPLQAWTQEIGLWGGRMLGPPTPPKDTEHEAQMTIDLDDWVRSSEQMPFTTSPPASLVMAIQQELSNEHHS